MCPRDPPFRVQQEPPGPPSGCGRSPRKVSRVGPRSPSRVRRVSPGGVLGEPPSHPLGGAACLRVGGAERDSSVELGFAPGRLSLSGGPSCPKSSASSQSYLPSLFHIRVTRGTSYPVSLINI